MSAVRDGEEYWVVAELAASLQATEAVKEALRADARRPKTELGSPASSGRCSLIIRMEPLQECRSPDIVVRTRLSLSCPTPGHLLSV